MNHTKDTWKIGNHEFTSRFILGSGKYSLDLIKAAVEQAKAQIITLAPPISWIISPRASVFCPILPEPEMPRRQCGSPGFPEKSAAAIW